MFGMTVCVFTAKNRGLLQKYKRKQLITLHPGPTFYRTETVTSVKPDYNVLGTTWKTIGHSGCPDKTKLELFDHDDVSLCLEKRRRGL